MSGCLKMSLDLWEWEMHQKAKKKPYSKTTLHLETKMTFYNSLTQWSQTWGHMAECGGYTPWSGSGFCCERRECLWGRCNFSNLFSRVGKYLIDKMMTNHSMKLRLNFSSLTKQFSQLTHQSIVLQIFEEELLDVLSLQLIRRNRP